MIPVSESKEVMHIAQNLLEESGIKPERVSAMTRALMQKKKCSAGTALIMLTLREHARLLKYNGTCIHDIDEAVRQSMEA